MTNDIEAAARVVVDRQGVAFGPYCWVSHDRIMGIHPDAQPNYREAFYRDNLTARKYVEWINAKMAEQDALAHAARGEGSLDATLADACEWFDKTIPHTADDDVTKFREESKEFLEQPSVEEAADAVLCLWHWAHLSGEDLHGAIRAKMAKNAARTWERQSNGTWHHVKRPTPPPATGEAGTRGEDAIRADERERCAKWHDERAETSGNERAAWWHKDCAAALRALPEAREGGRSVP